MTLQGDAYLGNADERVGLTLQGRHQLITDENDFKGADLLWQWKRTFGYGSEMAFQSYYDYFHYESIIVDEMRKTVDLDFQVRHSWTNRHGTIFGLGYRYTRDRLDERFVTYSPQERGDDLWSVFLQDECAFLKNRLFLTVGSKFEHNDYTGIEIQPNIRLLYEKSDRMSFWAAISRAVRTPNRAEHNLINDALLPPPIENGLLVGTDEFESETLIAYELGLRILPDNRFSVDIAGFYNEYDDLRTIELRRTIPGILLEIDNKMKGSTYGVELALDWRVWDYWRLTGAYTFLNMHLNPDRDSTDSAAETHENQSPRHQMSVRSSLKVSERVELDGWVRYVDHLPGYDVPNYTTLDLRIAWKPSKQLELSLTGRNLLDRKHPEFGSDINIDVDTTEVERSVYGKLTWRF